MKKLLLILNIKHFPPCSILLFTFTFFLSSQAMAQYTNLINFTGDTGSYLGWNPTGSLTLSGDTLYGMTEKGVIGYGNIFSVQTNGTNFKNLINFTAFSGSYIGLDPWGSLTLSVHTLYGMTQYGGINGVGNIFSFKPHQQM